MKLTDPAVNIAPIKDQQGKEDKAKTDKAKSDARKVAPGWARASKKADRDKDRQDRIDTMRGGATPTDVKPDKEPKK